jgi:Na+/pantothenate symporter
VGKFTYWGRRGTFRRRVDQQKGGYIDCYSSKLFFFLILIVGLNVLDALFTMMILDFGGWEANPIVNSAIGLFGEKFWVWKYGIVSASLVVLCLHIKFRFVKAVLLGITVIYVGIILHQIALITHL